MDRVYGDFLQKCSACTKGRLKAHGAPIQCTKGKCTKSFHVSCARDGANGVHYSVLQEVEKEVILVDLQSPSDSSQVAAEPFHSVPANGASGGESQFVPQLDQAPASRVLTTIKKNEVQVLCTQHNPVSVRERVPSDY